MAEVMQFDDLENFKNWWLESKTINTPDLNALTYVADTHGVVLYRQDCYQVEMFLVKPNSEIDPHVHPNVDSFEVYIGGDIEFMRNGKWFIQNFVGSSIRVYPNSWHGGKFGERGGCFLSIQKWLNNVEPKFVGDDWVDTKNTGSYKENRESYPDGKNSRTDQYFTKVDGTFRFDKDSFHVTKERIKYGLEQDGQFYGIKYFEVEWLDENSPLNIFPEYMHKDLCIRYMTINHAANPHTDSGTLVSVNFYMNTTNEATNFYELTTDNPNIFKLETQTDGSIFDLNDVKKVCSFSAKSGDIYVLDVTKIHSVMNDEIVPLPATREVIVVSSYVYDYGTIMQAIKSNNNG